MSARLLAPAAVLAAFAVAAAPAAAKQVKLTVADTGKTVTIAKGDTIQVDLDANNTTPYAWKVTTRPKSSVAKVTRTRYIQDHEHEGMQMPGSGGTQQYVIKAAGTGRTAFATQYQEISTGEVGTGKSTFKITIRVR